MQNVHQQIWYNQPNAQDLSGTHYDHRGLMQLDALKAELSQQNMQYYFCGPVPFMQHIARQLTNWGVKPEQLRYECFGPHKIVEF